MLAVWAGTISSVCAEEDFSKPEELVSRAQTTFERFVADPDMGWFRDHVKEAKAFFIVPRLIKAGFIFGGTGGSGALVARDERTNEWSDPAFYTMGSVTFGLQIGGAADEVILMVMTPKGMDAMLSTSFKLGADASVAAGPVGTGISGATADILAFSRSKGVFGGLTIEGAVIATRDKWNTSYYGKSVTAVDITVRRDVHNPRSEGLIAAVTKATGAVLKKRATEREPNYHIVRRGDTLYGIGRRYGVSLDELLRANRINKADPIHPGQKILIP
jgi:lipid-binding SYLF domain-containing protein